MNSFQIIVWLYTSQITRGYTYQTTAMGQLPYEIMTTKSGKKSYLLIFPQPISFEDLLFKLYMPNAWLTTFKFTLNTKLSNFAPKILTKWTSGAYTSQRAWSAFWWEDNTGPTIRRPWKWPYLWVSIPVSPSISFSKPFIYEAREPNKHLFVCVYMDD